MEAVKIQMAITLVCVIHRIPVCHPSDQRTRILREWMEGQPVHNNAKNLVTTQLNDK